MKLANSSGDTFLGKTRLYKAILTSSLMLN